MSIQREIQARRAEGLRPRDSALPLDPAVAKLHTLAETGSPTYRFLGDFKASPDSNTALFYGPPSADRLAKLQYNFDVDPKLIPVLGTELALPVKSGTWGSDVEFGEKQDRRLNEDAVLTIPFGNGRVLSAVFDGASSQRPISGLEKDGVKGAWLVSHLAAVKFPNSEVFKKLSEDPNTSAKDVMVELNSWLRGELTGVEGVDFANVLYIPGMAATIALIDKPKGKVQIAHVADTMAIAEYDNRFEVLTNNDNRPWDEETQDLVDQIVAENRQKGIYITFMQASKDPRVTEALARSFTDKINTPETSSHRKGTGIVNGMTELVTNGLIHTTEIDIPQTEGLKIHLLSDGLYSAWTNRLDLKDEESNRKLLAALNTPVYEPGSAMHHAFVRLKMDPDAEVIRRIIKAHDDASRVTIEVTRGADYSEFKEENQRMLWQDYAQISQFLQDRKPIH